MSQTDWLADRLRTLPANPKGIRLPRGLALRLTSGNGMHVLGCSRVDSHPSVEEMRLVAKAVIEVFAPEWLFQARGHVWQAGHGIWRLYWPMERVIPVFSSVENMNSQGIISKATEQLMLFSDEEE